MQHKYADSLVRLSYRFVISCRYIEVDAVSVAAVRQPSSLQEADEPVLGYQLAALRVSSLPSLSVTTLCPPNQALSHIQAKSTPGAAEKPR